MAEKIVDIVSEIPGNIPVILSSHHDGYLTALNGRELDVVVKRKNDSGTKRLTCLVRRVLIEIHEMRPYFLAHKIKLDRSTEEMFTTYIEKIFRIVEICLKKWGICYVFDIHRFYKHPELTEDITQEYEVWLGTNHRASIRSDFDKNFAVSLSHAFYDWFGKKIDVYVPDEKERSGECFGATGKNKDRRIIIKAVSDEFRQSAVNAVQIEFYKDLLQRERIVEPAVALCEAIAQNI